MNARINAFLSVILTFAAGTWLWSAFSYLFLDFLNFQPGFSWGSLVIPAINDGNWTRSSAFSYFFISLLGLPVLDLLLGLLGQNTRSTNHPLRPVLIYFRVLAWCWPGAFLASAWNKGGVVSDLLQVMGAGPDFALIFLLLGFSLSMIAGVLLGKEILQLCNSASLLQTHIGKARFAFQHQALPFLVLALMAFYMGRRNMDHLFFWWAGFTALGTVANAVGLSFGIVAEKPSVYKNSVFYKMDYRILVFGVAALGSFVLIFFKFI
jgi:hypothetical protein